MTRLTAEALRLATLGRQFPRLPASDEPAADVVALVDRLGPIQSQVPRSPFLTVSSRLPGVGYETVRDLFVEHQLLKTSSLRGTVHTTTRADFVRADAVSRASREPLLRRTLRLADLPTADLLAEIERFATDQWRPRTEIVAHATAWLAGRGVDVGDDTLSTSLIWGHSGLIRRPKDSHWEKRTDIHHRLASAAVELAPRPDPASALVELVRGHLRSCGPLTRADLSFFFGVGLTQVDAAVATLAEEVVRLTGPEGEPMLDLAELPADADPDPGVRLLPEFDGLLISYAGANRTRFCGPEQLARIWTKVNGTFTPVVLADGRLVAGWRTVAAGRRAGRDQVDLELTMLPGEAPLGADALTDQVAAVAAGLALTIRDVRVLT